MKWKPNSRRVQAFQDAMGEMRGKISWRLAALSFATSHWVREKSKSWTSFVYGSTTDK